MFTTVIELRLCVTVYCSVTPKLLDWFNLNFSSSWQLYPIYRPTAVWICSPSQNIITKKVKLSTLLLKQLNSKDVLYCMSTLTEPIQKYIRLEDNVKTIVSLTLTHWNKPLYSKKPWKSDDLLEQKNYLILPLRDET